MGKPYRILDYKFSNMSVDKHTDIVVEIGSGHGEGSTEFLCNWAKERELKFYTIDINQLSQSKLKAKHLDAIFVVQYGSEWCQTVLPTLDKKIKVLYLDNFDFPWPALGEHWLEQQRKEYKRRGVEMTAENSMEEHKLQTKYCLPFMATKSVILMDDTCYDPMLTNQTLQEYPNWTGKCATALPLMISAGYQIVRDQEYDINYATR